MTQPSSSNNNNNNNLLKIKIYNFSKHKFVIGFVIVVGLIILLHFNSSSGNGNSIQKSDSQIKFSPIKPFYPVSNEIDQNVLNLYRQQIRQRQQYLQQVPTTKDYFILYNTLVPEVFCRDLVRIGFIGDGGKWICNPSKVQALPDCVVYSLGTAEDPSFEESFQNFTANKCLVRSLDKDAQSQGTMKRIIAANGIFMKALIASKTNKSLNHYTFKDVLSTFGDTRVDILKIDIEGAEFEIQDELISVPICQILIEIHGKSAKHTLQLLQKFSKNGFYLFSYEINGRYHELSEYSFIHQDCFKDYGIKTIYGKYLS